MYLLKPLCILLVLSACLLSLTGCASGSRASEPLLEVRPRIMSVSFAGPRNAWLVSDIGDLWRTEDRGSSWEKVAGKTVGGRFFSISFIDARRGWAVGERGVVWRTVDGGHTWAGVAKLSVPGRDDWVFMGSPQMRFVDERHGWIIETLSVWRTEDGGLSWKFVLSPLDPRIDGQPVSGAFKDSTSAVIGGTNGELYTTGDGGQTWQVKTIPGAGDFSYISFSDESRGWLIGAARRGTVLLRTEDGGESWRPLINSSDLGVAIYGLNFIGAEEGWAVGRALSDYTDKRLARRGLVLYTSDGGKTWQQAYVGTDEAFFDQVHFLNRQEGWLFSRDKVFRTDDGGKSWAAVLNISRPQ